MTFVIDTVVCLLIRLQVRFQEQVRGQIFAVPEWKNISLLSMEIISGVLGSLRQIEQLLPTVSRADPWDYRKIVDMLVGFFRLHALQAVNTIQDAFNVQSKADMSQLNLPHVINN